MYGVAFGCLFLLKIAAAQTAAQVEIDSTIRAYIAENNGAAVAEMMRTGIPASITLAQAICESRFGTSKVAHDANNHFGIKCYETWRGKKYFHKDDEKKDGVLVASCFRAYATAAESYYDHSEFLKNRGWYDFLFAYDSDDYAAWAKGLNDAGYANAKDYDARLLKYITKFELFGYDQKGFPIEKITKKERQSIMLAEAQDIMATEKALRAAPKVKKAALITQTGSLFVPKTAATDSLAQNTPEPEPENTLSRAVLPALIDTIAVKTSTIAAAKRPTEPQGVSMVASTHTVRAGDTLDKIAKRYRVSVANICAYNKLQAKDTIAVGRVLKVNAN